MTRESHRPERRRAEALLSAPRGAGNHALARALDVQERAPGGEPPVAGEDIGELVADAKLMLEMAVSAVGLHNLQLTASVGRGGKNHRHDVAVIAARLAGAGFAPGTTLTELGNAIAHFQADVVGMPHPDGRIDPGGRTVAALRAPKPAAQPAPAEAASPPPIATGGDADADAVAAEIAELQTKFKALKHNAQGEELGAGRDELVGRFKTLRPKIDKLAPALRPRFYQALNAISPYYYQGLNIILEFDHVNKKTGKLEHVFNTCNITSLSMALEALGKTAADYKYLDLIPPIAEVFKGDIDDKATGKVGTDLGGLRLPDFVAMAAIVWQMGYKTGDRDAILHAGNQAFQAIPSSKAIATLARDFRVPASEQMYGKTSSELSQYGSAHHKAAAAQADSRKHKAGSFSDDQIEHDIPLEGYKQDILGRIGPVLNAGKQVVVGQYQHFVRLQAVTDELVIKDDPGNYYRANAEVTWEEARALGLFWNWIVIG